MKEKKIAVVMGGPSTEREVSLRTGNAILTALQRLGYQAVGIDLEPARIEKQLADCGAEVVFVAVHGKYGEDGTLQGLLELKQLMVYYYCRYRFLVILLFVYDLKYLKFGLCFDHYQ